MTELLSLKLTVKEQYDGSWLVLFSNGWEAWPLSRQSNKLDAIRVAIEGVEEMDKQLRAALTEEEKTNDNK